jgi:hypothetical protein
MLPKVRAAVFCASVVSSFVCVLLLLDLRGSRKRGSAADNSADAAAKGEHSNSCVCACRP